MAFGLHEALGTQNERCFVAAIPTAHSFAHLRIDERVTAVAARLATGMGGLTPRRTGFAPAGRRTRFHDFIASPILLDRPAWPHHAKRLKRLKLRGVLPKSVRFRTSKRLPGNGPAWVASVVARCVIKADEVELFAVAV